LTNPYSVVTLYRREQLCAITSGTISTIPPITQIALGTGGVDINGTIVQPVEEQTSLNNPVAIYPIEGITFPLTPSTTARYIVSVGQELAGQEISEAGLIDANGNLYGVGNFEPVIRPTTGGRRIFQIDDEW